jgi:glycosyltransferase involved in cell wall biosynthesis
MSGSRPKISLIIPTRERADTLAFTLRTALAQNTRDYEVIVSDNASTDATRDVVQGFTDPRVRYVNTGRRLSMCDNYEFGLEHATGQYTVYIGDDDAVMPGGLDDLVATLDALQAPTIHMWPLHVYDWPVGRRPAHVEYLAAPREPAPIDLKSKGRFVLSVGGWKYGEMPSVYHCAVPRVHLDGIRARTGRVFHSTQPDVFTALALPAFADVAINLGRSITFNGRSARSNGLGFVDRSARQNIERFIAEYGDYNFDPSLDPAVGGAANMIPDAVLLACRLFPELYDSRDFNFSAMWAYVCRLGFVSHGTVLRSAAAIRRRQKFRVSAFLFYSAIHQAGALRRNYLNARLERGPFERHTPDNIFDFASALVAAGRSP